MGPWVAFPQLDFKQTRGRIGGAWHVLGTEAACPRERAARWSCVMRTAACWQIDLHTVRLLV